MSAPHEYVSRAGQKLASALAQFQLDVNGWTCVDFGSHTGGFVDCLLHHGAKRVHAIDPGYGIIDWRLRNDPHVVLHERSNALTLAAAELCGLATIDVGWTTQRVILPAARRWLHPGAPIVTLVKPHYEAEPRFLRRGVLPASELPAVLELVREDIRQQHFEIAGEIESPIAGGGGNVEFLWLLRTSTEKSGVGVEKLVKS